MNTPTLKTERFIIRAFNKADLPVFTRYRSNSEVARYQCWSDFNYSDALALFEKTDYSNFGTPGQWYQLAIVDSKSNHLLGDLAVHFIDADQVEIGFTVAPEHQKNHVAKEAASAILVYLFDTMKMHRVIATTDTENFACIALLESLGFNKEAHFRQNIFFKGSWGDEYQYAMLRR